MIHWKENRFESRGPLFTEKGDSIAVFGLESGKL